METTKQIQGHIVGASGITACEQGLLNSTYHAHGRTQYVTKVRSVRTKTKRIGQIKARAAVQYTITATDETERCMDKHALMSEMEKGCNISAEAAAALERIKQVRGKPSSDARWIQKAQARRFARRPLKQNSRAQRVSPMRRLQTVSENRPGSFAYPAMPTARRYSTRSRGYIFDSMD